MAVQPIPLDTILAVDFGTATTRALLFDVVESAYRLVGYGEAPSTVEPPYLDASEGMRHALLELQAVTGRVVLDDAARLMMPSTSDGRGVDAFVATGSAGPPVRTLLVGLLPNVTLESARRVAAGHYVHVVDSLSLGDRRGEDQQIDAVIAARPELILVAGGTDGGASEALLKLVETVALACHLLPADAKAKALYVGNPAVAERVTAALSRVARVETAPNVRPQLNFERLAPARAQLTRLYEELRQEQIGGLARLAPVSHGPITPTAQAAGLLMRFLSRLPAWPRGVLGVDVGSASTSLAAAWGGELRLTVRADLGVGQSAQGLLAERRGLDELRRWVPFAVETDALRDFLLNKTAHPHTIPADPDDLQLEQALARAVLRLALAKARPDWPEGQPGPRPDLLPWFNLILAGGTVLGNAPRPGLAALMLLDALQPGGVTRLMLDPYHLAPALGAVARVNPVAVVQVYDSLAFIELGTAISLVGRGRPDEAACGVRLLPEGEGAKPIEVEVKAGTIEVLPLQLGQAARLTIQPRAGWNAGFGAGRGRNLTVRGGAVGVIIDARGRPIIFPREAEARRHLLQQWTFKMGGS